MKLPGRGTQDDVDDILGAYCYALGAGAGGLWIKGEAIRAFREYFRPAVSTILEREAWGRQWDAAKTHVLEYVRAIGRTAAQRTIARGAISIDRDVMKSAINEVRAKVPLAGDWCPL